jgi:hypothetical protein
MFRAHGIDTTSYESGTIVSAFGKTQLRNGHDALNDARTILDGLVALEQSLRQSKVN